MTHRLPAMMPPHRLHGGFVRRYSLSKNHGVGLIRSASPGRLSINDREGVGDDDSVLHGDAEGLLGIELARAGGAEGGFVEERVAAAARNARADGAALRAYHDENLHAPLRAGAAERI